MIGKAKKALLSEIHKLTPNAQQAAEFILEKLEESIKEMAELRTRLSKVTAQDDLPNEEWRDIKDYEGLY